MTRESSKTSQIKTRLNKFNNKSSRTIEVLHSLLATGQRSRNNFSDNLPKLNLDAKTGTIKTNMRGQKHRKQKRKPNIGLKLQMIEKIISIIDHSRREITSKTLIGLRHQRW